MRLRDFSLPLAKPLVTATGTIEKREGVVIRLGDGVGEASPLPGWTESVAECRAALDGVREDVGRGDEEAALAALDGTPAARHGLELAIADREARAADEPLYRHLGGERRIDTLPVNATVGDAGVEETVGAVRRAVDAGFLCVKVKVGARSVDVDARRLLAVREAVGPDVALRVDANGSWSREEATHALDAFADAAVEYVEQPLAADDLDGYTALRGGGVGIALDETLATVPIDRVIAADAADVLICKPMVLGGVRRARDVARRAREAGIEPVVTGTIDGVVARTAAVHLATCLAPIAPCGLATAGRLASDLGSDPAPVENGRIRVPQGAGTGVSVG